MTKSQQYSAESETDYEWDNKSGNSVILYI